MSIPKIKFRPMTLKENIDLIKWAFYEDDDNDSNVKNYTIKYFPELEKIDLNISKKEVYNIIENIVSKKYNENKEKIIKEIKRYNNIWDKYNDKYFNMLIDFLGVSFPDNIKQIDASVGMIPIYPRYLDSFSFSVAPDLKDWEIIKISVHETLHFLWFEKWKTLYPKTPRKNYDYPYIEWKYSEMVTDPILNNKPFNELFDFIECGYDSFYRLYDGDELVMDKLRNIYKTSDSVEDKIEKGYKYITEYFNHKKSKIK